MRTFAQTRRAATIVTAAVLAASAFAHVAMAAKSLPSGGGPKVFNAAPMPRSTAPITNPGPKGTAGSSSRVTQTTEPDRTPSCMKGMRWCPTKSGRGVCMIGRCASLDR